VIESTDSLNVGRGERLVTIAAGGALILLGTRRRGVLGLGFAAAGSYLVFRGVTGWCCAYDLAGINTARSYTGLRAESAVTIDRPAGDLYRFWRDFENLPRFMDHLESVTVQDERHSHWVAKAPFGRKVEWDAQIINEKRDELIVWRSLDGADVQSVGSVSFTPMRDGRETEVKVVMQYDPPGRQLGAVAVKLLGVDPAAAFASDLEHLKRIMEGERGELVMRDA
jgi:uncharacterized membrane protein